MPRFRSSLCWIRKRPPIGSRKPALDCRPRSDRSFGDDHAHRVADAAPIILSSTNSDRHPARCATNWSSRYLTRGAHQALQRRDAMYCAIRERIDCVAK